MMIDEVIILAAGHGRRMESDIPKVLQEICGTKMLHMVYNTTSSVDRRVLVTSAELVKNFSDDLLLDQSGLRYVIQDERRGTGHAVSMALSSLNDSSNIIAVTYADTPFVPFGTIEKAGAMINKGDADLVVIAFKCLRDNQYGKLRFDDSGGKSGKLVGIVEKSDNGELCNSGVIVARNAVLQDLVPKICPNADSGEYYLTDLVKLVNDSGKIASFILSSEEEAMGINSCEDLVLAGRFMQEALKSDMLRNGVKIPDFGSVYLSYGCCIGSGSILQPNVYIGSNVKIGKNCVISPFARLENCTLEDNVVIDSHVCIFGGVSIQSNSVIHSFSWIDGAVIGSNCAIGPFARLRSGTFIGDDSKIGNFVEIKNSRVGKKVRASHLSYIGDAEIGDGVNIGAGAITCNYNGFNKFNTKVGKGAFIGSNTLMVAPMTVGSGCIVGAGSILKEDIEEETLVIPQMVHQFVAGGAVSFKRKKNNNK